MFDSESVCVGVLAIARRGRRSGVDAREQAVEERRLLLERGLELGHALREVGGRRCGWIDGCAREGFPPCARVEYVLTGLCSAMWRHGS